MKKRLFLYPLLLSLLLCRYVPTMAQANRNQFTLVGTINRQTGPILLIPLGGEDTHPATTSTYQTTVVNGHFTLTGEAPYPLGFLIASFPDYVSNPFLVEAGTQSIQCNADSIREIPRIDNRSMRELERAPVNFFATHSLGQTRKKQVLTYVKQHPSSYVGLWTTVQMLGYGYDPLLDSTYRAFSPTLRQTFTGAKLGKQLVAASITAPGKTFPAVSLLTPANQRIQLSVAGSARYTLVDLWFSRCGACIDEFPELKQLYATYRQAGFEVVQLSIDKKADFEFWKNTIQKHNLPWPQYLDESGRFIVGTLSINAFPTNFLVDQQGRIVRKDVRMDELKAFLAKNIIGTGEK